MDAAGGIHRKRRGPAFGDAPTEKVLTLADDKVKTLLNKQLTKKTTLTKELTRKPNISEPILVTDETVASVGIKSLTEFQAIMEREKHISSLREHGLTEREIGLKLDAERGDKHPKRKEMKIIEEKISKHQKELSRPDQFSETLNVNRRDLETECASGSNSRNNFSFLIKRKEQYYPENDPVNATLKAHPKLVSKINLDEEIESDESDPNELIGPVLCSVNERVTVIPEEMIMRNRLSLQDILSIERFKDYKAGEQSRTLYIKNLAKNTSEKDLARLFARYYVKDTSDVKYKIMTGRMRGQAFITFQDELTATQALLLNNGFSVNGKPIIISYSKMKR